MAVIIPLIFLRFILTFIFALIFGLERQRSHKPIGFGTFIFVSMGSCGLGILATSIAPDNPLPLLGAIVTGIGFLGAGALIKTTDKVFGFTTASGIWVFAIIGLLFGAGYYLIAVIVYASVWGVLFIDRHLEKFGIGSYQKKITIVANRNIDNDDIEKLIGTHRYKMVSILVDKKTKRITVVLLVEARRWTINKLPKTMDKEEWVESFGIE